MRESGEEKVCFPNILDGNGSMKYSKSIGKLLPSGLVLYSLEGRNYLCFCSGNFK